MKYFVLLFSLFLFPLFVCSQTWRELNDSLIYYYTNGEFKKAIPVAEKTVMAAKSELGESDINYPHSITYLAMLYNYTGQQDKAETFYVKAAELYKILSGENHTNYATGLNNLAGLYQSMGKYEKAEPLLIQETAIRKKLLGENHPDYASCLHNLGVLYTNLGKNEKAEPFLTKATEIRKQILGETHPDYATSLDKLGVLYTNLGEYEKTEPLLMQAIAIKKNLPEGNNLDYTYSLSNLGILYQNIGNYQKAEPLFIESIAIQKKILGENHPIYATSLNNLAGLYETMGNYDKAEPLLIQGTAITKSVLGENHPDYATGLNNLAGLYESLGNYEKAEPLYLQSTAIVKKVLGENHPYYANSLHNQALLYSYIGKYEKSEQLFIQTITITKKRGEENSRAYATMLHNLAALYKIMGSYEKAELIHIESAAIRKKILGENHPDYANSLHSLAALYLSIGKYEKAEPLFIQVKRIRKKVLGENHPLYATSLIDLAMLYESMGSYEKAEEFFIQGIAIDKKTLGENHPDYATGLNNLALLYTNMGSYEKAEPLFMKSTAIRKKMLGENSQEYATGLNNLARLYEKMGNYGKAETFHTQARSIFKIVLGENHPNYATSLNNLAVLYKNMGKYENAKPLFIQATAIRKIVLGENHPDYATSLNNEAELYESMGNYEKAESLLITGNKIKIKNLLNIFSTLSEKEKGNYLANNVLLNNSNNSFLYNYRNASSAFYKDNYNLQLLLKGLSLAATKNAMEAVRNSKDTSIKKLFTQWQKDKIILSNQYSLPVANRKADIKETERETENLEKELNRFSVEFRSQQNVIFTSIKEVQNNLKDDEVAIEFISFHLYNKKWTDSTMYAAFVLRKNDSVPIFVPLCEEKQLQKIFDSAGTTATSMVNKFYRGLEIKNKNASGALGTELYKLIWQPLQPFLKNVKKVSYSPAGKLYSIAFQALPVDSANVLMDKYQLQQYTSTRQVVLREQEKQNSKPQNITLFGDAIFTIDSLQLVKQKMNQPDKENVSTSIYTPKKRSRENNTWSNLPGTAQEVKTIQKVFEQNKITTKTFTQTTASEENLKALSGNSPQILHIATHGFFLPEPDKKRKDNNFNDENTYTLADDPLLRSGLILSGGNYAWSGKIPIEGLEDGIATAYEISQLNLSNTELVVLSACETALGDVKGSEGVFGLQRAFKMAGVKKMIVSLWQVPDKETAELMTAFYAYWMKGKTINDAFAQAQADMRKKYSPFYWAAFVLVE